MKDAILIAEDRNIYLGKCKDWDGVAIAIGNYAEDCYRSFLAKTKEWNNFTHLRAMCIDELESDIGKCAYLTTDNTKEHGDTYFVYAGGVTVPQ